MTRKITKRIKRTLIMAMIPGTALIIAGCAAQQTDQTETPAGLKQITDIEVTEDSDTSYLMVRGHHRLTYTSIKQNSPLGILFYFPETRIEKDFSTQPDNELIETVSATQMGDDVSGIRVWVALKQDVPYEVSSMADGIKFAFAKPIKPPAPAPVEETMPEPTAAPTVEAETPPEPPVVPATMFSSVYVTKSEDRVKISLIADGMIEDYQTFTMSKPPRIVIDLNNLKSRYDKAQTVKVNTPWLSKIRHFGHPDKVRVVLETSPSYVDSYSATPTPRGLDIWMGAPVSPSPSAE